jgi:hypothetical protein
VSDWSYLFGIHPSNRKWWLKEARKKDCNSDPHSNYTKASKRILGHHWLLQALDTWVSDLSCPFVSPSQGRRNVCVDPRSPENLWRNLKGPTNDSSLSLAWWETRGHQRSPLETLRPWKMPVAYLSKKLDPVANGCFFLPESYCCHSSTCQGCWEAHSGIANNCSGTPHSWKHYLTAPWPVDDQCSYDTLSEHFVDWMSDLHSPCCPQSLYPTAWDSRLFTYSITELTFWQKKLVLERISRISLGLGVRAGTRMAVTSWLKESKRRGQQWWTGSKWSGPAASLKECWPRKSNLWLWYKLYEWQRGSLSAFTLTAGMLLPLHGAIYRQRGLLTSAEKNLRCYG